MLRSPSILQAVTARVKQHSDDVIGPFKIMTSSLHLSGADDVMSSVIDEAPATTAVPAGNVRG